MLVPVVVVAVNDNLCFSIFAFHSKARNVRFFSFARIWLTGFHLHKLLFHLLHGFGAIAREGQLRISQRSIDLKEIKHRLVDPLGGESTSAFKTPFSREHERPGKRPDHRIVLQPELFNFFIGGSNICGVILCITENHIGVVIYAARSPAIRICFREHYLQPLVSALADDIQPNLRKLYKPLHRGDSLWGMHFKGETAAFYMIGDKVQASPRFSCAEIDSRFAVL